MRAPTTCFVTLCAGGDGTISGNSNVIPEHFVAIYDAFRAGDYALAQKLQRKTNLLIDHISGPNNMARYKEGSSAAASSPTPTSAARCAR